MTITNPTLNLIWLLSFGSLSAVAAMPSATNDFSDTTVYFTDFTEQIGDEWTSTVGTPTQVAANGELFLGTDYYASGAGTTTLTLTDLPPHSQVAIAADLYIINSWDGNASYGTDNFQLTADATNLLFTNFAMTATEQTQAYPNQLPPYGAGGKFPPSFGAYEIGHLGEILGEILENDATYRLAYRFAHTEPTLELAFTSMQNEAASNESWGLDNVQVNVLTTTTLSVVKTGAGNGYVTSAPFGIDCGIQTDCTEDYPLNTTVILTATTAAPGNRFNNWVGCPVIVSGNTCSVKMTENKTLTANFTQVPDFLVTKITTPPLVFINTPFTTQVTVKNQGLAAGNAGRLALWLNSPTAPACRAISNKSITVNTLAIGQSKIFNFTELTYTTAGNKFLRAFVDADCITLESDDNKSDVNNNQLTNLIIPGGPDLIITTLSPMPSTPMANSQFAARVMVKNQGLGTGSGGTLSVWANQLTTPTPVCKPTGNAKVTVGALAAGASASYIIPGLDAGVPGTKNLRAFIDSNCMASEANANVPDAETNNQLIKPYRVEGMADLVITSIVLIPATPAANSAFVAKVIVKNQGTATSAENFVDVWLNQPAAQTCGASGDAWASVGTLAPGASTTVTVNLTADAAGAKTMRALVDNWCEIVELNESNNQFTKSYTVR